MGLFSGITEAFNNVTDSISSAFSTMKEQVHDVFYSPKEYITKDVTITPTKQIQYEEWLIEQNAFDFRFLSDYTDILKYY